MLLVLASFTACKDDNNDNNGDPNNEINPLIGNWYYNSPTVTHSLIFLQNTLKSVQTITTGPIANKNVLEGPYSILSSGTVVSFDITSATQNDVEKPEWYGLRYYITGLFSEDSLQFLEAVEWERITGKPDAMTGGKFHRFTSSENNGETTYTHYRMDFGTDNLKTYSAVTENAEIPQVWDTENTTTLVVQDDHFYTSGDPSNGSYFRLEEGNLYLSDYLPHVIFKRL